VVLNLSADPIPLPEGEVLLSSEPVDAGQMPGVSAAWIARAT
jgi:alpha-glucosidase